MDIAAVAGCVEMACAALPTPLPSARISDCTKRASLDMTAGRRDRAAQRTLSASTLSLIIDWDTRTIHSVSRTNECHIQLS